MATPRASPRGREMFGARRAVRRGLRLPRIWLPVAIVLLFALSAAATGMFVAQTSVPKGNLGTSMCISGAGVAECCVPCPSGETGCYPNCSTPPPPPPPCSIAVGSTSVAYSSPGAVTVSWTYSTAGSGTVSFSLTYTDQVTGTALTVSPATSPTTLGSLNVPRVYQYVVDATFKCSSATAHGSGSGYFWTASGSGGSCPEGAATIPTWTSSKTASEFYITWSDSPAGSTDTFSWGTSTSYSYSVTPPGSGGSGTRAVNLYELDPGTTYYWEVTATPPAWQTICYSGPATASSSFTTSATPETEFSGYVTSNTGSPAPAGFAVVATCDPSSSSNTGYTTFTLVTGTAGAYSLTPPEMDEDGVITTTCVGQYTIQALNPYTYLNTELLTYETTLTWPGYWNETISTYAPGIVDFYLQPNTATWLPASEADLHTINASVDYTTTVTTTTDESWNYGGNGGSTTASVTATAFGTIPAATAASGETVIIQGQFDTSGTSVFDATGGRTVSMSALSFFDDHGSRPIVTAINDTLTSAPTTGGYCLGVAAGGTGGYQVIQSTTYTSLSGYSLSIELEVSADFDAGDADLGPEVGVEIPLSSEIEQSSGHSTSITLSTVNHASSLQYFWIYPQSGGTAGSSTDANVIHVWELNCSGYTT
jgi:hypothetical protein